eukprot:m.371810 g.371810  ORF g.371810 m.371810 type:complete len:71 (+) comp28134_c1_seq11:2398-2610(+)
MCVGCDGTRRCRLHEVGRGDMPDYQECAHTNELTRRGAVPDFSSSTGGITAWEKRRCDAVRESVAMSLSA